MALRGGIVDVFPTGYTAPVRLEFVGDEVESVREFDAASQRSLDRLEEVLLLPAREFGLSRLDAVAARAVDTRAAEVGMARQDRRDLVEAVRGGLALPGIELVLPYLYDRLDALADYLPPGTVVWTAGAGEVDAALEAWWTNVEAHAEEAAQAGRFHPPPERLLLDPGAWRQALAPHARVEVEALDRLAGDGAPRRHLFDRFAGPSRRRRRRKPARRGGRAPDRLAPRRRATRARGARRRAQRERLAVCSAATASRRSPSGASFAQALGAPARTPLVLSGELSRGAWLPADRLVLVTEAEVFGEPRAVRRGRRARGAGDVLSTLAQLRARRLRRPRRPRHRRLSRAPPHAGRRHRGRLPASRVRRRRSALRARSTASTSCSATSAATARRRRSTSSAGRPGSASRRRPRESVLAMAHELIAALRRARGARARAVRGAGRPLPGVRRALRRSRRRPTSSGRSTRCSPISAREKPMDRLVCGDVGFGKTEVAMRAAFLAVLAGKQVAVLVPTTILAQQHSETFGERFEGYPITIDMLSRFRSAAENKATIEQLAHRPARRRDRDASPAAEGRRLREARAADRRRGAPLRGEGQGAHPRAALDASTS